MNRKLRKPKRRYAFSEPEAGARRLRQFIDRLELMAEYWVDRSPLQIQRSLYTMANMATTLHKKLPEGPIREVAAKLKKGLRYLCSKFDPDMDFCNLGDAMLALAQTIYDALYEINYGRRQY